MGRHCKAAQHKRRPTTIRFSAIERGRFTARAQSLGLTLSAYLRQLADRDCEDAPTTPHPIGPLPPLPQGVEP